MRKIIIIILLLSPTIMAAQSSNSIFHFKNLNYYIGGGYSKSIFAEAGLGTTFDGITTRSKLLWSVNYELHFQKPFMAGTKVKAYMAKLLGPLGAGINLTGYGLFAKETCLALSPEAGLSIGRLQAFYQYNLRMLNADYDKISKNVFGLYLWLGKKKI